MALLLRLNMTRHIAVRARHCGCRAEAGHNVAGAAPQCHSLAGEAHVGACGYGALGVELEHADPRPAAARLRAEAFWARIAAGFRARDR